MLKSARLIQFILIGLAVSFLVLRFGLSLVVEPYKAVIWNVLPLASGIIAFSLILISVSRLVIEQPRKASVFVLSMCVGLLVGVLPMANSFLGLTYPSRLKTMEKSLSIRVPIDGPAIVAWGGDSIRHNYHAEYADQRWAYDLVTEPHSLGSGFNNEDFGCFGKPILSPISGEIRTAVDGESDRIPDDKSSDVTNAFGNYIVMKPDGTDERLIIAHLKMGSVRVKRGDTVQEGDLIAECGNSGNSTEPHIHIHYIELHELGGETIMTGLPLYFRDHDGPKMPLGGLSRREGDEIISGDVIEHKK